MAQWDLQHEKGARKTKLIISGYSVAKYIFQIFIIVSFVIRTQSHVEKKSQKDSLNFLPKNSPILIQNVPQSRSVVTVPRFSSRYISSPYLRCKVSTIQYIYIFFTVQSPMAKLVAVRIYNNNFIVCFLEHGGFDANNFIVVTKCLTMQYRQFCHNHNDFLIKRGEEIF